MKTAILKTNLWDDDEFYELNIDTKLLYLLLMSAPERGVSDIYSVSDRILSARSGLADKQLSLCKKQLEERGLVMFSGKFVKLAGSAYVLPKKGRFTEQALEREYDEVPDDVLASFAALPVVNGNSSLIVELYDDTIHKDKDVDKDNNVDVDKSEYGNADINYLFDFWEQSVGYKLDGNRQRNRNACNNLIKKHGKDGVQRLISGVARANADRYAPRISDFIQLQSKYNDLIAWGKREIAGGGKAPKVVRV